MSEMTAPLTASVPYFQVGKVLGQAFHILFRHFPKFFLIFFAAMVPSLMLTVAISTRMTALTAIAPNLIAKPALVGFISFAVTFLCQPISQGTAYYGTFQDMRHRPFHLGPGLASAFMRYFPFLGTTLSYIIACFAGGILLAVPGLMLATSFAVAAPACMIEELGPLQSLSRSAALTKGHRWKIFGFILVLLVASAVVGLLVRVITLRLGGAIVLGFTNAIWSTLYAAYTSVATAVMYHDLRVAKEGIDTDRIAAVFD